MADKIIGWSPSQGIIYGSNTPGSSYITTPASPPPTTTTVATTPTSSLDPIYEKNKYWMRPGEDIPTYNKRVGLDSLVLDKNKVDVNKLDEKADDLMFPDTKYSVDDLFDSKGMYAGLSESEKSEEDYYKKRMQMIDKMTEDYVSQSQSSGIWGKLTGGASLQESREQYKQGLYGQYGISPEGYYSENKAALADIEARMLSYDQAKAQKDQLLLQDENRLASTSFIKARMTETERMANIQLNTMAAEINTKIAIMEYKKGNFESAMTLVNQAVDDYTADIKYEYDRLIDTRNFNYKVLQDLKSEYQEAYNMAVEQKRYEYEQARQAKFDEIDLKLKQAQLAEMGKTGTAGGPTSYQEWSLAGGKTGTGMSYADWLNKKTDNISTPTLYGLTKEQSQDVFFAQYAPQWFVSALSQHLQMSPSPTKTNQEWNIYKKEVKNQHKEIKESLGGGEINGEINNESLIEESIWEY